MMAGKKARNGPTSSTGTGGPSSEAASVKDPMEAALDNSISSMKAWEIKQKQMVGVVGNQTKTNGGSVK